MSVAASKQRAAPPGRIAPAMEASAPAAIGAWRLGFREHRGLIVAAALFFFMFAVYSLNHPRGFSADTSIPPPIRVCYSRSSPWARPSRS